MSQWCQNKNLSIKPRRHNRGAQHQATQTQQRRIHTGTSAAQHKDETLDLRLSGRKDEMLKERLNENDQCETVPASADSLFPKEWQLKGTTATLRKHCQDFKMPRFGQDSVLIRPRIDPNLAPGLACSRPSLAPVSAAVCVISGACPCPSSFPPTSPQAVS